jgi:hypothetical protein
VETSGDGRVNFYSRVQMYLFKAKQAAVAEYDRVCEENGVTREQVAAFLEANPRFRHPLHHPAHHVCGTNADLVVEVAPYITKTPWQRAQARVGATATKAIESARVAPSKLVGMVKGVTRNAPVVAGLLKEDVVAFLEERKKSRPGKGRSSEVVHVEAAAE